MAKACICAEVLNGAYTRLWAPREGRSPDSGSRGRGDHSDGERHSPQGVERVKVRTSCLPEWD